MGTSRGSERAILKVAGSATDLACSIVEESATLAVVVPADKLSPDSLPDGTVVALLTCSAGQTKARSGKVTACAEGRVEIGFVRSTERTEDAQDLTECQLPAMFRPRSRDGHYGCWKGAIITKHGPDRLYLEIEDDLVVPKQTELMFSPIGADSGGSGGRMYGDDGSVINAADVRSRRIRVRAITRDVLPSETPGTISLVMDITRTLYRTA
ncbi:MAG: hypothetical protein IH945_08365 [Armatimonadetes bacterium]|nr:hypothetical protein [Armatimonadota bacterium]